MSACVALHEAIPPWKVRAARRAAQRTCEHGDSRLLGDLKRQRRQQQRAEGKQQTRAVSW